MDKKNTVFKKRIIYFALCGFVGILLGIFTPFLAGFVEGAEINVSSMREVFLLLKHLTFILVFMMGIVFYGRARDAEKNIIKLIWIMNSLSINFIQHYIEIWSLQY